VQPRRHLHFYDTEDVDAEPAGRHPSVIFTSADDVQDNRGSMEACGMEAGPLPRHLPTMMVTTQRLPACSRPRRLHFHKMGA
jgi:hypothetical protein